GREPRCPPAGQSGRPGRLGAAGALLRRAGGLRQARRSPERRARAIRRRSQRAPGARRRRRDGAPAGRLLPKSRKARRRLMLLAAVAPVLILAVGLTLWGLRDSISFFYSPSQAQAAAPPAGRAIQLGGLVSAGSVVKHRDGRVE